MNAGESVTYAGERWVSRGCPTPGRVTIQRADNPRVWKVVDVSEVAA